jgi:hypothetical protein
VLDAFVDAHENGWGTLYGGAPVGDAEVASTVAAEPPPPRVNDDVLEWLETRPAAFSE